MSHASTIKEGESSTIFVIAKFESPTESKITQKAYSDKRFRPISLKNNRSILFICYILPKLHRLGYYRYTHLS